MTGMIDFHGNRIPTTRNYLSDTGARHLAENIRRYWVEQGYPESSIHVYIEKISRETSVVRSNLRNGSPPGSPPPTCRDAVALNQI